MAPDGASSIAVTIRVRPFTIREAAQLSKADDGPVFLGDGSLAAAPTPKLSQKGLRSVIKVVDDKCLVFDPPENNPIQRFSRSVMPNGRKTKDQTFCFDKVFDDNTTQGDVYEATTKGLLDSVLDGFNATVFAYGATGCGKTHTITGTPQQPGIIFLTMQELFERVQDLQSDKVTELSLSYLEIYNETIRDLLAPSTSKTGLALREDAQQTVSVTGLSSHHPQTVQEVMDMIVRGNELRTMSPTEANATSSRSHAVLQVNISMKDRNADVNEPHTMATLSIIDLAGSERASATKNRGERLMEGANINKSLLALGSCINALCDPRRRNHVPYRNSKLTRLLKFSLGGNCRTVMIVCVSPSSAHFDETQNTLRYANRAKNIQTKVSRNVYNVNRHVQDYLKKINEQMSLIHELKQQQKDYEGTAFIKFRKQSEKREAIAAEAMARVRSAYDHSANERKEKTANMKKLRQIERRISLISSWIAAFDGVTETRDDESPPTNLIAMRKTGLGIQAELEASRQHYHQRLAKNTWERSLDSAVQTGVRQLNEVDVAGAACDVDSLTKEGELLKSNADRDMYNSVMEQEKAGDVAIVQVLLQTHFETVAIINQIMAMDEEDAVQAARNILGKLIMSCSEAASQVIKPDGGLPVTEAFPPMRTGTPKRRKPIHVQGPSPMRPLAIPQPSLLETPRLSMSPVKHSPRRRLLGPAKKGVSFSPKKRSPSKIAKRSVRWKDDTEDGTLVEFQATPQRIETSPECSSVEMPKPTLSTELDTGDSDNSSPTLAPPQSKLEAKPRSNRFQTGFLSKKSGGSGDTSPNSSLLGPLALNSSDSDEPSPLREIEGNSRPTFRSPLRHVSNASLPGEQDENYNGSGSSSDDNSSSNNSGANPLVSKKWSPDTTDAEKIRAHMTSKRASLGGSGQASRIHRRRSPTHSSSSSFISTGTGAGHHSNSPPAERAMFSAGQARRMGRGDSVGGGVGSVLSPRTAPVSKGIGGGGGLRRTTLGAEAIRGAAPMRVPSSGSSGHVSRGSLSAGGKGVWR